MMTQYISSDMKITNVLKIKSSASVTYLHTHLCCHPITVSPYILASNLSLMLLLNECAQAVRLGWLR